MPVQKVGAYQAGCWLGRTGADRNRPLEFERRDRDEGPECVSVGKGSGFVAQDDLKGALSSVVAPLIEADGGELFLVPARGRVVHLHLRGRFSGCPGNLLVAEQVLKPVIEAADPAAKVQITSGAILPEGAERIAPTPSETGRLHPTSPVPRADQAAR